MGTSAIVIPRTYRAYKWSTGQVRPFPQPAGLWLPSTNFDPPYYPLTNTAGQVNTQILPRPDAELEPYSFYKVAFYDGVVPMLYRRPIAMRGGSFPYNFELLDGPPGMAFGAASWQSGWGPREALLADYGNLLWTPTAAISSSTPQRVWVRAYDQNGSWNDFIWYVYTVAGYDATNQWGYVFLDPVNGTDPTSYPTSGVVDTASAPIKTLAWAFGSSSSATYPNAHIVLRNTGVVPANTTGSGGNRQFTAGTTPVGVLGFPGENPTLDLTTAGTGVSFSLNADDSVLGEFTMINGPPSFSVTTQPTGTLTDGVYYSVPLPNDTATGSGAVANITVSGGVVTEVREPGLGGTGKGYATNTTVYIPASAIPGATADGVATIIGVNTYNGVNGVIGNNFMQAFSDVVAARRLLYNLYLPNVFAGTIPVNNASVLTLLDPDQGVPHTYVWMKGVIETNRQGGPNNCALLDWYVTQYCGHELCQVLGDTSTMGGPMAKASVADYTERCLIQIKGPGGQVCSSSLDQWNGLPQDNHEYCYNILDTGTFGDMGACATINLAFTGSVEGGEGNLPVASVGVALSTAPSTLAAGAWYFKVTVILLNGEFFPSSEVTVTTTSTDPSATISWGLVEGDVGGYRVYFGTTSGGEDQYVQVGARINSVVISAPGISGTPPTATTSAQVFGKVAIYRNSMIGSGDVNAPTTMAVNGPVTYSNNAIQYGATAPPIYISDKADPLPSNVTNTGTECQASSGVFNDPAAGDYSLAAAYASYTYKIGALIGA